MLAGCRDAHEGKYLVTGTATWNGAPIEEGFLELRPLDGKSPESGKIAQGRFSFYARPGENRVSVNATKEDGRIESMNQPRIVQYIPSKYNLESKLTCTVEPRNDNSYDLSLVEEPGAAARTAK